MPCSARLDLACCGAKHFSERGDSRRMECKSSANRARCNCTYEPCPRKGVCCDCLVYHLKNRELPACCFPADVERTYARSFERFAACVKNNHLP